MPRYLIIDGYNAISKISQLEAKKDKSLEEARLSFIGMLNYFMHQKRIFDKVLIVFDSKEKALGVRRQSYGKVDILFATVDRDADSVIVDLLRKASSRDEISVASDDNFVRNHAKAFGRDVISIGRLKEIIMLKKEKRGGKIKEKVLERGKVRDINEELKKHWRLS